MYPKIVYQLRETLFDEFDLFGIPYTDNQKLFNTMAFSEFESICVDDNKFRDNETKTWTVKNIPISA